MAKMVKSSKPKKKPVLKSVRAGITFPVGRLHRVIKQGLYTKRVSVHACVYMSGILERIITEILSESIKMARSYKRSRVTPRILVLVVKDHPELSKVFSKADFSSGGVIPFIHPNVDSIIKPKPRNLLPALLPPGYRRPSKGSKKKGSLGDGSDHESGGADGGSNRGRRRSKAIRARRSSMKRGKRSRSTGGQSVNSLVSASSGSSRASSPGSGALVPRSPGRELLSGSSSGATSISGSPGPSRKGSVTRTLIQTTTRSVSQTSLLNEKGRKRGRRR